MSNDDTNGKCGLTIEAAIEQTAEIIRSIQVGAVSPAQFGGLLRLAGGLITATASQLKLKVIPRLLITGAAGLLEELAEGLESGTISLQK